MSQVGLVSPSNIPAVVLLCPSAALPALNTGIYTPAFLHLHSPIHTWPSCICTMSSTPWPSCAHAMPSIPGLPALTFGLYQASPGLPQLMCDLAGPPKSFFTPPWHPHCFSLDPCVLGLWKQLAVLGFLLLNDAGIWCHALWLHRLETAIPEPNAVVIWGLPVNKCQAQW